MKTYQNITINEMESFLFPLGFQKIEIPNTKEIVFGKRIDKNSIPISMRVYSGIVGNSSRGCGDDAIRVNAFAKTTKNEIKKVVTCRRVNRIGTWRKNLESRIREVFEKCPSQICKCGNPMVVREGKLGEFLGCSNYPECKETRRI